MPWNDNPSTCTPEHILEEVARIFAAGLIRLHRRRLSSASDSSPNSEKPAESGAAGLDDS